MLDGELLYIETGDMCIYAFLPFQFHFFPINFSPTSASELLNNELGVEFNSSDALLDSCKIRLAKSLKERKVDYLS